MHRPSIRRAGSLPTGPAVSGRPRARVNGAAEKAVVPLQPTECRRSYGPCEVLRDW